MAELVIRGTVATMTAGAAPSPGAVWIRDGRIVGVTHGHVTKSGFSGAATVDVGDAFVLPGLIDMHNHLGYNTLPLWSEPGRTEPWLHNHHWTDASTYTPSITEPAYVYAKAVPQALLGYVQVRELAGGATAAQGWPTANGGYGTVVRNVDSEDAGTGRTDLIYTSVATKTGDALLDRVDTMTAGSGFIYHCAEGQRGSRVRADYTELAKDKGLLPEFIGIHCCAVGTDDWTRWDKPKAGGVVWSPTSNMLLYAQTTLIPDVQARNVLVCLGSDWGPSGTKNVLGELKVARIMSDQLGYGLTDHELVEMVTCNPGRLLERYWNRPIGRLVAGAYADITVLHGRGHGDAWAQIVAATEADVALVVVDGVARYGDSNLMTAADAPASFATHIAGRSRRVALPDPADTTSAWSWNAIETALHDVQHDPQAALHHTAMRAAAGPGGSAPFELYLDMPDSRRLGRAGPPKHPENVEIPPVPTLEHDHAYFTLLERAPIPGGALDGLEGWYS